MRGGQVRVAGAARAHESSGSGPPGRAFVKSKTILLVDDSEVVLLTEQMLLSPKYELLVARDGEEGVAMALAEKPDLILMDVVMPKLGGFEACRELRRHVETEQIPVVMVTTRGEWSNVETGFDAGCNDYVTKPIQGTELLEKIKNLIGD